MKLLGSKVKLSRGKVKLSGSKVKFQVTRRWEVGKGQAEAEGDFLNLNRSFRSGPD